MIQNLNLRELRSEPHVDVGLLIQRDASIIIERWLKRVVREQPDAARLHHQSLIDHLPSLLYTMGQSLAVQLEDDAAPDQAPAERHGEHRWETGWSLPEVVRDYQILRLVIFEYLEENLDRPLSFREGRAIDLALDEAISASVSAFSRQSVAELRRQAEALKEADQHKTDFLAVLAHELRNPLASVVTSMELLRLLDGQDPRIDQARAITERQVKQMVRLVDDLLDLTRIARGKLELRRTVFMVGQAMTQAVQTVLPLMQAQGHQLTVDLPTELIHVEADELRIVQVLVNLLNNAAKYTERGGHINVSASREGDEVVLRVRDDGIGIEGEKLAAIFTRFTQIDRSLHRSRGGLGVGLALVRQLVELHGGQVSAHSEGLGKGSEFVVRLPALKPSSVPLPSPSAAAPASTSTPAATARRILLIEDNTDACETLSLLLRMLGHHVESATTGPEGVARAVASRPQIALIDLGLPGLDGFEVARQIRAALGEAVLLVALSGYTQEEDRRRAEEAGFDAHLPKPIELEELSRILSDMSK